MATAMKVPTMTHPANCKVFLFRLIRSLCFTKAAIQTDGPDLLNVDWADQADKSGYGDDLSELDPLDPTFKRAHLLKITDRTRQQSSSSKQGGELRPHALVVHRLQQFRECVADPDRGACHEHNTHHQWKIAPADRRDHQSAEAVTTENRLDDHRTTEDATQR